MIFYRSDLLCIQCHIPGDETPKLGPDISRAGKDATDTYLVESLLFPSKVIKKGFETISVTTTAGKKITGLLASETAETLTLRDASDLGRLIKISKKRSKNVRLWPHH